MISGFFDLLYTILIRPIILLLEVLFSVAYRKVQIPLFALTVTSLVVNLLVLPLYNRADILQEQSRQKEAKLRPMADHIKKTFKGDEKVMMVQAYYNEMKYNPLEPLKSSVSLLLQIPFFIAAYNMISGLAILSGSSAGPIKDLGQPDAMFSIGSFTVNILPILMTVINILSCLIVVKGKGMKEKLQLFLTAGVFLVLLYNSPAGLVYYWTCNNIFSLIKSIVLSFKSKKEKPQRSTDPVFTKLFIVTALTLSVFIGVSIPADYLVAATPDLMRIDNYADPAFYLIYSFAIAFGIFFVWCGVFFALSSHKKLMSTSMLFLILVMIFNYFCQNSDYGGMSRFLTFVYDVSCNDTMIIAMNILVGLAVVMLIAIIQKNRPSILYGISVPILLAFVALSAFNVIKAENIYRSYSYIQDYNVRPEIKLSSEGKNVVVIMLDRAQGAFFPYVINEKEELRDSFDGFTYYKNCISYGSHTNIAAPAMMGGYDYTPMAINERSDMSLQEKHNESILLLPVLFEENGYDVTVCDPPYANYMTIADLSIFDPYPNIDAYFTYTASNQYSEQMNTSWDEIMRRDLFFYSLMMSSPEYLRAVVYDEGFYNDPNGRYEERFVQRAENYSVASGVNSEYLDSYYVLDELEDMTLITDQPTGCYLFMENNATHSPLLLDESDYSLSFDVDNTQYDAENTERFAGDRFFLYQDADAMGHYQANVASYMALADWFDYLKECGVYDNTRIIIVSDHGGAFYLGADTESAEGFISANFNPVLLVKDFDAHGFEVSEEFMTNAETPYLATYDVIDDPVNPFTGEPIRTLAETDGDIIISNSAQFFVSSNNGNTFLPDGWYRLDNREDPLNVESWEYAGNW